MADLEVNRSIQFVSLDTHPANNALVVTYEISVLVIEQTNRCEVARRNKRDQLQISISALDQLTEKDLKADKLVINLQELSAEIVRKCPLLLSERNNLEDVRLHLLYLIGRRQSQLLAQRESANGSNVDQQTNRPLSSVPSARLRSGQMATSRAGSRYGVGSARKGGVASASGSAGQSRSGSSLAQHGELLASATGGSNQTSSNSDDVYSYLYAKELGASSNDCNGSNPSNPVKQYMEQFDEHLTELEDSLDYVRDSLLEFARGVQAGEHWDLENYLEGLYGDNKEKLISMSIIRHLSKGQVDLAHISSNRLLVCAMLRTLRDTSATTEATLCESIFYCLIRFTSFEDIYVRVFVEGDPIDLVKVVTDLLANHVKILTSCNDLKLLLDRHFYTNSLLIILMNLVRINSSPSSQASNRKQYQHILSLQQQQQVTRLLSVLNDLFQLASKYLAKDIRLLSKPERITSLLSRLIFVLRQLSIFKEFVNQFRSQRGFVDSAINLVSTLQLSRPGSGAPTTQGDNCSSIVTDKKTLNDLYELEISLLRLINNLMFDPKLRIRMIKKNLLKCVLRNLVVFLASRKSSNTLSPFQRSSVLMVPFKSLYELSCGDSVKGELYKSKIIMRCLLEYLLSATIDLKQMVELTRQNSISSKSRRDSHHQLASHQQQQQSTASNQPIIDDQIVVCLEPDNITAAHYIVSLWINLSARREAAIYNDDSAELKEFVCEYIELTISNLRAYLMTYSQSNHQQQQASHLRQQTQDYQVNSNNNRLSPTEITIYLHMKLMRNLTQFLEFKPESQELLAPHLKLKWIELVGQATNELLPMSLLSHDCLSPLSVECLATLGNLMTSLGQNVAASVWSSQANGQRQVPSLPAPQQLAPLLERLFLANSGASGYFEAENDDLLLVSILFLGTLARDFEICQHLNGSKINPKIISASNFILDTKLTDREMIIASLCTLGQLLNHSSFLNDLCDSLEVASQSRAQSNQEYRHSQQQQQKQIGLEEVEQLVDRLASLMLSGDSQVARLTIILLNRLRQFEEQRSLESPIYRRRFVAYNEKWLNAIRASREELTDVSFANLNPSQQQVAYNAMAGDEGLTTDELSQLRAVEAAAFATEQLSGGRSILTATRRSVGQQQQLELADQEDEFEDDEANEEESLGAPDLNVIDANSMIKHLTSRREFRSEWLHK